MPALFEDMKPKGYCVIPPTPETEQLADIIRADVMRIGDEQVKNNRSRCEKKCEKRYRNENNDR